MQLDELIPNITLILRWSAEKHEKTAKNLSTTLRIWNPYNSGPWSLGIFGHIYVDVSHVGEHILKVSAWTDFS